MINNPPFISICKTSFDMEVLQINQLVEGWLTQPPTGTGFEALVFWSPPPGECRSPALRGTASRWANGLRHWNPAERVEGESTLRTRIHTTLQGCGVSVYSPKQL